MGALNSYKISKCKYLFTFLQVALVASSYAQSLSNQYDSQQAAKRGIEQKNAEIANYKNQIRKLQGEVESRGTIIECVETNTYGFKNTLRLGFIDSYAIEAVGSPRIRFEPTEGAIAWKYSITNGVLTWKGAYQSQYEYVIKTGKLYSSSSDDKKVLESPCTIIKGGKY